MNKIIFFLTIFIILSPAGNAAFSAEPERGGFSCFLAPEISLDDLSLQIPFDPQELDLFSSWKHMEDSIIRRFKPEGQVALRELLPLVRRQYGEDQFSNQEYYYNHVLEVAYYCSRWGGNFSETVAALLHRLDARSLRDLEQQWRNRMEARIGRRESRNFFQQEMTEIRKLLEDFAILDGLRYRLHSQSGHSLENYIGAVFNLMGGDVRLRELVFADKRASINHASEREKEELIGEINDVYAPLAGRFGMFDLKKELENECFRIHRPVEYKTIKNKIKRTFGVEYENLPLLMQDIVVRMSDVMKKNDISYKLKRRIKTVYRIAVKEKVAERKAAASDTLLGNDTLGLRLVVDPEDFLIATAAIQTALENNEMGSWRLRLLKNRRFGPYEAVYFHIDQSGNQRKAEIQLFTPQMVNFLESEGPHWAYEKERETNKQKFEHIEPFSLFDVLEDSEGEEDVRKIIDDYFRKTYEFHRSVQGWVYVFERTTEIRGGVPVDVIKPHRLAQGATAAVFAAERGVSGSVEDFLEFSGISYYRWQEGRLIEERRSLKPDELLRDGEIIGVTAGNRRVLETLLQDPDYRDAFHRAVRPSLRGRVLLQQALKGKESSRYEKLARQMIRDSLEELSGRSLKMSPLIESLLDRYAERIGLGSKEELFIAMTALEGGINAREVSEWLLEQPRLNISASPRMVTSKKTSYRINIKIDLPAKWNSRKKENAGRRFLEAINQVVAVNNLEPLSRQDFKVRIQKNISIRFEIEVPPHVQLVGELLRVLEDLEWEGEGPAIKNVVARDKEPAGPVSAVIVRTGQRKLLPALSELGEIYSCFSENAGMVCGIMVRYNESRLRAELSRLGITDFELCPLDQLDQRLSGHKKEIKIREVLTSI